MQNANPNRKLVIVLLIASAVVLGSCFVCAILGAVLSPVFAQAREKARATACMSNLRQMGSAFAMYAQDHRGQLPPASRWMDAITPYLPRPERTLRCPSVPAQSFGYAYNSQLSGMNYQNARVQKPDVPLVYDSVNLARNATDPVTSLPNPPRHLGNANHALLVDGTVQSVAP
ncbi:MAG: DUF1559 domain-containing protein [Fimbriimonadales bacterium]|nr:DUF1559 domain-containing protein [Fimbriimonadales bacterium]